MTRVEAEALDETWSLEDLEVTSGPPTVADRAGPDVEVIGVQELSEAEPSIREVSAGYLIAKRALDLAVGVPALVLTSPIMAALSLATRFDSPGPAFFRQQRVGQGGKVFTFYKYRTMYLDARERFPELYAYHEVDAAKLAETYYKQTEDPRHTRVGRFLRKTSLDELPNFINVVKGDLSLVGPRPELPEYVRLYDARQRAKFAVKPGATGLAVVDGRNLLSMAEQIEADVEYTRRRSFRFDLEILLRTVWIILRRRGAT
ncbi:MAG: sugar transferase [Acidimicrobiia bacterium]